MTLNGREWASMLASAACALENEKEKINQLNVFPVPDGDTGINLSMTISPVRKMAAPEGGIGAVCKEAAGLMLRSARGNSGAIFSLFFRGMGKTLEGVEEANSKLLAKAFQSGTEEAYRAVMNPTEGTILTVMRLTSEEAEAVAEEYSENILGFFRHLLEVAQIALARTPELLPVLRQARVVDAGGAGFVAAFSGLVAALEGAPITAAESAGSQEAADFGEFDTEDIHFAYCTECIVEKAEPFLGDNMADAFRSAIAEIGDSMVFIEDECIIKVHIHTNDPGFVLSRAVEYGALATVKVENMKSQHSSLTGTRPEKPFGFISVCVGDGIAETFRELGCDRIVTGGQSMNPSTEDILNAIKLCNAETVFLLPNNKNIFLVAKEAATMTEDKKVLVIESRSVPEGLCAMLNFDPENTPEDNLEVMTEAIKQVKSYSVTHAARDSQVDGFDIKEGQFLGLRGGKILTSTDTLEECVTAISKDMKDAEFITVFAGCDATEEAIDAVKRILEKAVPEAETAISVGGQPLYDFIISAE